MIIYPDFEKFKQLAKNNNLDDTQKVGFKTRENEGLILPSITKNIPALTEHNKRILDIGCGCSKPVRDLIKLSREYSHSLFLNDSKEMLDNIDDHTCNKIYGQFEDVAVNEKYDIIIVYSVLQSVYTDANIFRFIDKAAKLLNNQGVLFLGDIPNSSKQNRFIKSPKGKEFLKQKDIKPYSHDPIKENRMDDSIIINIILRMRMNGFESYLLPQEDSLPYSNVRDDILIVNVK